MVSSLATEVTMIVSRNSYFSSADLCPVMISLVI